MALFFHPALSLVNTCHAVSPCSATYHRINTLEVSLPTLFTTLSLTARVPPVFCYAFESTHAGRRRLSCAMVLDG